MKVQEVIIHEIAKVQGKTGAKVVLSNGVLNPMDIEVINLISELNSRYRNRNENYGIFDAGSPTRFHEEFSLYSKNPNVKQFVNFSHRVSNDLREKIDAVAPARGGYLIFTRYTDYRDYFGVFLIRDVQGTVIRKRNSSVKTFDIGKVEHIDFEKMAMACRINIKAYKANEGRYLSFINKKSDTISKYFTSWISSTDTETNEQDTRYFVKMIQKVPRPAGFKTADEFQLAVHRYIATNPNNLINLRDIGLKFFDDEGILIRFAEENEIRINTEFKSHSSIKRLIEVRAKVDNIEIAFKHDQWNKAVRTDGNKIIITSKELVDQVKELANG